MKKRTEKITITAMFSALAFITVALIRIPVVLFLSYEPKDVIITVAGLIMGPLSALLISLAVSFVEMITISDTGIIGFIMNVISSCAFACTAAFIYKKRRTFSGALLGVLSGCIAMTAVMLLWNYIITPIYMGYPREAVVELLVPAFLPFNLLKGGMNAALTLLLYKPLNSALKKTRLLSMDEIDSTKKNSYLGYLITGIFLTVTCILLLILFKNS